MLRISAKVLGEMALESFCPRCFWIKLHCKKLPWQIFPGIFSSIDAYTKKIVHRWIANPPELRPGFLNDLYVDGFQKVPHWSKFNATINGVLVTGVLDDIWTVSQPIKGIHLPDYKTAKYTPNQDKLKPMYDIQLNTYRIIAEACGLGEVTGVSLVYMEPQTSDEDAEDAAEGGGWNVFDLQFVPTYVGVPMGSSQVFELIEKARTLYEGPAPEPAKGCKDCEALEDISQTVWNAEVAGGSIE